MSGANGSADRETAISILAHNSGRAVYTILPRKDNFDENYFFSNWLVGDPA